MNIYENNVHAIFNTKQKEFYLQGVEFISYLSQSLRGEKKMLLKDRRNLQLFYFVTFKLNH